MRLLTHNFLISNVKGTEKGYPLKIEVEAVVEEPSQINPAFLWKILPKLDWAVVRDAALSIADKFDPPLPPLPEERPSPCVDHASPFSNVYGDGEAEVDPVLTSVHRILMDAHLIDGSLVCPDTGRIFPVKEGIPNMVLHEDEL
eukprot:CAMPEP_0194296446 /NCGR_PEP_ID=MMETSP0169-20130528/56131_1 /TAXON_ID=218684 /ORGANISM="Corethron pennatum, Strain L29A3" /LENGTH=143 /DNA_ID=CAMNT_0039045907 /DNA_START=111 /DNA_END=542 /DNA_ORIENTATION=-